MFNLMILNDNFVEQNGRIILISEFGCINNTKWLLFVFMFCFSMTHFRSYEMVNEKFNLPSIPPSEHNPPQKHTNQKGGEKKPYYLITAKIFLVSYKWKTNFFSLLIVLHIIILRMSCSGLQRMRGWLSTYQTRLMSRSLQQNSMFLFRADH